MSLRELITEHLDLWTGAVTKKSSSGRGSNGKVELTGVKKLRELILELAVRGKLVDQIQEDEPPSELLKKIAAEKNKRIEKGEIKKPKKLPAVDDAELPFQIPASWKFIRLGDAVDIIRGITFPASEKSKSPAPGRLACLRTTNVQDTIEVHDLLYIKESFVTKNSQYIQKNDIVMSMANSRELVGKVAFIEEQPDEPMTFGGFLGVLRPTLIHPKFLMAVLRAPHSRATLIGNASQTTNIANISIGKLNPLIMGLPPLEEQYRIVQKVDELMALCDRLEQQTSDQLEAHETLVDTLLGTLTQSQNATELADNWARLAAHFDTLFTTEQSIDKLKQTILQLAVMGRLVEHDAGDEPASLLLRRLAENKKKLASSVDFKKAKRLPEISEQEIPFEIPKGWALARWNDITDWMTYGFTRPMPHVESGPKILTAKNIQDGHIDWSECHRTTPEAYEALSQKDKPENGDILLTKDGSIGRAALIKTDEVFCINQSVAVLWLRSCVVDRKFLILAIQSPYCQKLILEAAAGAAIKHLSITNFVQFVLAVPPLQEQRRIVKKVDELMALCEQLKERLNHASDTRREMARTVVEQAVH